jgi:hypothetical protein
VWPGQRIDCLDIIVSDESWEVNKRSHLLKACEGWHMLKSSIWFELPETV